MVSTLDRDEPHAVNSEIAIDRHASEMSYVHPLQQ